MLWVVLFTLSPALLLTMLALQEERWRWRRLPGLLLLILLTGQGLFAVWRVAAEGLGGTRLLILLLPAFLSALGLVLVRLRGEQRTWLFRGMVGAAAPLAAVGGAAVVLSGSVGQQANDLFNSPLMGALAGLSFVLFPAWLCAVVYPRLHRVLWVVVYLLATLGSLWVGALLMFVLPLPS